LLVIVLALMTGMQVYQMARGAMLGALPWMSVVGVAMPLVIVVACRRTVVGASSVDGLDARATRSTLLLT